jgi:hypothetical protein
MMGAEKLAAELIQVEERIRPTICPTFGAKGETIEGRISNDDFSSLILARLMLTAQHETLMKALAYFETLHENEAARQADAAATVHAIRRTLMITAH